MSAPLSSPRDVVQAPAGPAGASSMLDLAQDGPDGHGLVGLDEDPDERAGDGRGHLGVDLVGRDLEQRLVGLDLVADLLVPLEHRSLGHRIAHLGHGDLHGGAGFHLDSLNITYLGTARVPLRARLRPWARRLKHWGWGYEDQQPSARAGPRGRRWGCARTWASARPRSSSRSRSRRSSCARRGSRCPGTLAEIAAVDPHARASHALGKAYRDVVRGFRGQFDDPPDAVLRPRDEHELERVLDWACSDDVAVIPYGGGTSVVGRRRAARARARASRSTCKALDRVLEVDRSSRAARIQAGATGPGLEDQLREHDLTLRHFPQSFEYSTLGGWIATRAGGHFATLMTHIDDLVESVRALTPGGWWESRRLPGSGAGPSPDRMLIGSEGTLGVITEAWMRVQDRPRWKASAGVLFDTFDAGRRGGARARPVRPLAVELPAARRGRGRAHDGGAGRQGAARARLRVGRPPGRRVARARARAGARPRRRGARVEGRRRAATRSATWRNAFVQAPYLRDSFVAGGVISDTFETAITWDRWEAFVAGGARARRARRRGDLRRGARDLPLHARLPGRAGAVLHGARARRGAAARSSSGTRSRRRCQTRHRRAAARSRTTTRSGATTGRGTTVSGRTPFARGARRREARARPGLEPQPRRAAGRRGPNLTPRRSIASATRSGLTS